MGDDLKRVDQEAPAIGICPEPVPGTVDLNLSSVEVDRSANPRLAEYLRTLSRPRLEDYSFLRAKKALWSRDATLESAWNLSPSGVDLIARALRLSEGKLCRNR